MKFGVSLRAAYQQMDLFLGSLGGNMGLFLGMSILSVIEVIIYLCKISWLFVSRKRRQHMIAKDEKVNQLIFFKNT